jgi:hypothetical protein
VIVCWRRIVFSNAHVKFARSSGLGEEIRFVRFVLGRPVLVVVVATVGVFRLVQFEDVVGFGFVFCGEVFAGWAGDF